VQIVTGLLAPALAFARLGFRVFPAWPVLPLGDGLVCGCNKTIRCESPGKHPMGNLVKRGVIDASNDLRLVEHWWRSRPDANIAIATGDVIVLDVDPRHGGTTSLAQLERKHGPLPATWRVRTGGGGEHIYFSVAPGTAIKNSAGLLGDGLDVRGVGGYVLGPPSAHISGGRYTWNCDPSHTPITRVPAWIIAASARPDGKGTPPQAWRQLVCGEISEGRRNDTVAKLAGHLLRRYIDPHVALDLLMAWNQTRCQPPLALAEIKTIVDSIARRELKRRTSS
jgi:hypothetical protein